jgi:nucleotide-binding universal stress UspA family protein
MRLERILIPVDFSERSRAAFRYAVQLARATHAQLDLLHVVPSPTRVRAAVDAYLGRPIPHTPDSVIADARDQLDCFLGSVDHSGLAVHAHVLAGDPASMICEQATEQPDDLIVIGTHGRIGLADLMLGSIAKRIMTCAPCPVVTLRSDHMDSVTLQRA